MTQAETRVLCIGMALLDLVFELDTLPARAGKHFAAGYREVGGGIAANGAVSVARLGGRALLCSRVGDDDNGKRIGAELRDYGVDIALLQQVADCASALSCVLVDRHGERLLINHRDPRLFAGGPDAGGPDAGGPDAGGPDAGGPGLNLTMLEQLRPQAVLADLRWPEAALSGLRAARQCGLPALLDYDQSPDPDTGDALLAAASHVVFGREALAELSCTDDPAAGLRQVAERHAVKHALLGVTLGGQGLLWLDQAGRIRRLAAYRVPVVDTLAAGDVFHGALALALAERQTLADGLRFASAAAALKCTRPGGRLGIPDRAAVEQLMTTQPLIFQ